MANSWAISAGIDLHLDRTGGRVRVDLEAALRDAVSSGRLPPGLRLPSSRTLAADLGIARNTVAEAYGQLVAEGWLVARQGSGTRVADRITAAETPVAVGAQVRPPRYDLRAGSPDTAAFPRTRWLAATRRALNAAPAEALGYPDPRGRAELRQALAGYLARARGVRVSPDRVVICAGFIQALGLLSEVIRDRGGTTVATEAYSMPAHRGVVAASGLRTRTLGIDQDGAEVENLGDADAVLLTPAHQFPLGVPLAPGRRTQVIQWADAADALVVEDDYDGEFRYDRQPVGAMQARAPERVVYAGTASKSLAPGLRLGWLVAPARLVDDLVAAKRRADMGSSAVDQLTLAEFISCGDYDRQVRRSRLAYRRRRDRLVRAVRRRAPQVRVTGIAAGLHALLELPAGQQEDDVVARAARHGVAVEGLATYRAGRDGHPPALVVGYGTPPEHAFTTAVARLTAVLAETAGR